MLEVRTSKFLAHITACCSFPSFFPTRPVEPLLTEIHDSKLNQDPEGDELGLPEGVESFANSLEERALVRKLDQRILPLTCLLYLFASLDRSNLGNARLQLGLPEDVLGGDKTGVLFDWLTSAFYVSYILFQIPATIFSKLVPPQVFVATAATGWVEGFNFAGLMAARFVLGFSKWGLAL